MEKDPQKRASETSQLNLMSLRRAMSMAAGRLGHYTIAGREGKGPLTERSNTFNLATVTECVVYIMHKAAGSWAPFNFQAMIAAIRRTALIILILVPLPRGCMSATGPAEHRYFPYRRSSARPRASG